MTGSTRPSSNLSLTNNIWLTHNTWLPTGTKKLHIKVEENGIYSDCDGTIGQEWDKAVSSPLKNEVHSIYLIQTIIIFSLEYCLQEQIKVDCCFQGLKQL